MRSPSSLYAACRNLGSAPFAQPEALEHLGALVGVEQGGLGLELDAHADHLGATLQLRGDRRDDGVDVVELILGHVDQRQHRSVGEQEVALEERALPRRQVGPVDRGPRLEDGLGLVQRGHLVEERPVALGGLAALLDLGLDRLEVGVGELELDDGEVLQRVGRTGDVVVREGPQHEDDGVDLADVAEELVAQPLPLARPRDEPADVDELHGRGHDVLALAHLGERVEAGIGHPGHAHVGVGGGEGVRRGQRAAAREGVVQRRLACVGETDEPEPLHGRQGTGPTRAAGEPLRRVSRRRAAG